MQEKLKVYAPTFLLLFLCLSVPESCLVRGNSLSAFTFHFTHANIFHLLANFYVIARFRPRLVNLPVAYLSATAAALVPIAAMPGPTVGISAIVFAMLARRDAILHIWNWQLLGLNLLLAFVPCYNWKIHMLAYIIAFVIWKIYLNLTNRLHSRSAKSS